MITPCRQVCVLNTARTLCIGCRRTVEEITQWSRMTEAQRQAVMARIEREQA